MEVVNINQALKVRLYINMKGDCHPWESLAEEKQKEIGTALNDKALRAVGYHPADGNKGKINFPAPTNADE